MAHEWVDKLRVEDLKKELKKRGQPVAGKKQDLIDRLLAFLNEQVGIAREQDSPAFQELPHRALALHPCASSALCPSARNAARSSDHGDLIGRAQDAEANAAEETAQEQPTREAAAPAEEVADDAAQPPPAAPEAAAPTPAKKPAAVAEPELEPSVS